MGLKKENLKNKKIVNPKTSKKLICMYNFLPYSDISSTVVAKRIYDEKIPFDVIHNRMRNKNDKSVYKFVEDYMNNDLLIGSPNEPHEWNHMKTFLEEGINKINEITSKNGEYEEIYSRSMYLISHLLAFNYKIKNPSVKWTAEFSDPILYNPQGNKMYIPIDDEYMDIINTNLKKQKLNPIKNNNICFLAEYLPYLLADKIIFTNINQEKYMLSYLSNENIKKEVMKKSIIKPHPTPDKKFYTMEVSNYKIDNNKVNIGYFGSFLENRNIDDVYSSLYTLDKKLKDKCKLHIFTSEIEFYENIINCMPIKDNITLNPYVNYLEFLNLTTKFDCLIVNDTDTSNIKGDNPYLPSKISDYLGSGTDIWGLCERNSPISKLNLKYKSYNDDINSTRKTLERIIKDKKI